MQSDHRYVCIIAGGAGTRLWPQSRNGSPKQFQSFGADTSLLRHMFDLAATVVEPGRVCAMTVPEFADETREQLPGLAQKNLLLEPSRRDNGPAVLLALAILADRDPKAEVAFVWADHLVGQPDAFTAALTAAFAAVAAMPDAVVRIGTDPVRPDTGLGYIKVGAEAGTFGGVTAYTVTRSVEKPDAATAAGFLAEGGYLWNVGYGVVNAVETLELIAEARPETAEAIRGLREAAGGGGKEFGGRYAELPKESIETLLIRHAPNVLVIPAAIGWCDVGNWNVVHERLGGGLVERGDVTSVRSENTLVMAQTKPVVLVGVSDLIIIDAADCLLVMHKDRVQDVKLATEKLKETNPHLL